MNRGSLCILLCMVVGCANEPISDPKNPEGEALTRVAQKKVGSEGGTISTDDLTLSIPAGALEAEVEITIEKAVNVPSGFQTVSTAYRFLPTGLKFTKPVPITFKYESQKPVTLYWSKEGDESTFERATGKATAWAFIGEITHFSIGFVAQLQPPPQPTLSAVGRAGHVYLSWSRHRDDEKYKLFRAQTETGPFTLLASDLVGADYEDHDVANALSYFYYIVAVNAAGESPQSAIASAKATESFSDTQAPQLVSLTFSPITIDTSSSSASVTATATLTDNASLPDGGHLNIEIRMTGQDGSQFLDFTGYSGAELAGGTALQRTFEMVATFPQGSAPGSWQVSYVRLADKVGNSRWFDSSQLAASGFPYEITNAAASGDLSPPELLSLSFSPSFVDTSTSARSVTATIELADNSALPADGYMNAEIRLAPTGSSQFVDFAFYTGQEDLGSTTTHRTFTKTSSLPAGSKAGTWEISYLSVRDLVGNGRFYNATELATAGFPTAFTNSASFEDVSAPTLTALSISPQIISTSSSGQAVTVTTSIAENFAFPESNYMVVEMRFQSPSGQQFVDFVNYSGEEELGGTQTARTYTDTSEFPVGSETGNWTLQYLMLHDGVGNRVSLNAAEVQSLGFPTTIQVQ